MSAELSDEALEYVMYAIHERASSLALEGISDEDAKVCPPDLRCRIIAAHAALDDLYSVLVRYRSEMAL